MMRLINRLKSAYRTFYRVRSVITEWYEEDVFVGTEKVILVGRMTIVLWAKMLLSRLLKADISVLSDTEFDDFTKFEKETTWILFGKDYDYRYDNILFFPM